MATRNKCLTSSNKKLLVTSASLLVTRALLLVTRNYANGSVQEVKQRNDRVGDARLSPHRDVFRFQIPWFRRNSGLPENHIPKRPSKAESATQKSLSHSMHYNKRAVSNKEKMGR